MPGNRKIHSVIVTIVLLLLVGGCVPPTSQQPDVTVYAFTATWCPPCQADKPKLHRLQESGFNIIVFDSDEHPEIFQQQQVTRMPTYLRYEGGHEVLRSSSLDAVTF